MFKFDLNAGVKDKVTGYAGVVMGRAEYNTGCKKYAILSKGLDEKGEMREWTWIDETRLESTDEKVDISPTAGAIDDRVPPEA